MPLNDSAKQFVNSENGSAIGTVMVAFRIVVQDGRLTTIDEQAVFDEIAELVPAYLAEHVNLERRNKVFAPVIAEIHRRATQMDIGRNRYQGDTADVRRKS